MKICLINNLYKPYAKGGAEKVVEMTAQGLRGQGHEVFVITAAPLKRRELPKSHSNDSNVRIYNIWSPNLIFYGNLGKLPALLRVVWHFLDMFNFVAAWSVKKNVEREKPDMIFLHNLKGLSYLIPKFLRNENLVLIPHDVQLADPSGLAPMNYELRINNYDFLTNWYGRINKILFNDIKTVISPSKWLLDFYNSHGFFKKAKKVVLHNPTLSILPHLNPPPQRGGGEEGVTNLLFVGQLEESKGILFLINTLKSYKPQVTPHQTLRDGAGQASYKLIIVGDGSRRDKIEKLIVGDTRFKYLGKLDGEALQKIYEDADYTIVPSLIQENCPTVILESAAYGTPVIASRIGGIPELVRHGENGILFNAGDAGNLIELLERLPNFDWQKLSEVARFSAKIHAIDRYVNLLINFSHKEDEQNALEREPCQMCQ